MTNSTSPTESSFVTTSAMIRSQVPSRVHNRSRSCAVFHGPYRSGISRQGAPVRSCHRMPLMTCR